MSLFDRPKKTKQLCEADRKKMEKENEAIKHGDLHPQKIKDIKAVRDKLKKAGFDVPSIPANTTHLHRALPTPGHH